MIRRSTAVALAAGLLVSGCAGSDSPTGPPTSRAAQPVLAETACADLVVLGLRGSTQSAAKNHGSGQEVLAAVRAMSRRLHRERVVSVRLKGIPYRAESAASAAIYQANVDDGMRRTRAEMNRIGRACPGTRLALVGFSQGAQVVHEVAGGLSAAESRRIALVAMIADPRRNPDDSIASWTYRTRTTGPGKLGPGPALGPGLEGRAIAFCVAGDEICSWPPGGYAGGLSDTHRHFYEKPAHARQTGDRMAAIALRTLPRDL
jgi:hypothetical protein